MLMMLPMTWLPGPTRMTSRPNSREEGGSAVEVPITNASDLLSRVLVVECP